MKCLSIPQPWAWAIVAGRHHVEYRCYASDYRGAVLIHAGGKDSDWNRGEYDLFGDFAPPWDKLLFGQVIGLIELWDCQRGSSGEWTWCLRNPRLVKPFRFEAGKRLFEVDSRLVRILPSRQKQRG